jgi:hypothetical protein
MELGAPMKHVTKLIGKTLIPLAQLEAMADWKESIQGRIENQRVRLNLGLPDNDPHLAEEVRQFAGECRHMIGEGRR